MVFVVLVMFATVLAAGYAHAKKGRADLMAKNGSKVSGTVLFEDMQGGVRVRVKAKGLSPGKHGFHIHAKGDCSSPDGKSAGGHYNPEKTKHGGPDSPAGSRHAGDLGNLTADGSGNASLNRVFKGISIQGGKNPIAGRGLIIHAKADDQKSQPTGAAGGRIACGVIGVTAD
jgi:Cu-Zn family superoxide dismutase